jgi:glycosyltransferase involved in cell wall biosynthesis
VTNQPLVSICIPTYNGERFLKETLESVVQQTYTNLEIKISDHSSSDSTLDVIRSFDDPRIVLSVLTAGGGAEANWNASVAGAKGKYTKLLCQDDLLKPSCIEEQVNALESNEDSSFCFAPRDIITPKGRVMLRSRGLRPSQNRLSLSDYLNALVRSGTNIFGEPCCVLMKTSSLQQVDPFSGSYLIDLNMWIALWEIGDVIHLPKSLSQFRISDGSWTSALDGLQTKQIKEKFQQLQAKYPQLISSLDVKTGIQIAQKLEKSRRRVTRVVELLHL